MQLLTRPIREIFSNWTRISKRRFAILLTFQVINITSKDDSRVEKQSKRRSGQIWLYTEDSSPTDTRFQPKCISTTEGICFWYNSPYRIQSKTNHPNHRLFWGQHIKNVIHYRWTQLFPRNNPLKLWNYLMTTAVFLSSNSFKKRITKSINK